MSKEKALNKTEKQTLTRNIISAIYAPKIDAVYQDAYKYGTDLLEELTHEAASFYNEHIKPGADAAAAKGFKMRRACRSNQCFSELNGIHSESGDINFCFSLNAYFDYAQRLEFLAALGFKNKSLEQIASDMNLNKFKKPNIGAMKIPVAVSAMFDLGVNHQLYGDCYKASISVWQKTEVCEAVTGFNKQLGAICSEMLETTYSVLSALDTLKTRSKIIEAMPDAAPFLPDPKGQITSLVPAEQVDNINKLLKGAKAA